MKYKHSLRFRITVSFLLFGMLLSALVAYGAYLAIEDIEEALMEEGMQAELSFFMLQTDPPLGVSRQISADMVSYYVTDAQKMIVPDFIRDLPPGAHEVNNRDQLYHVLVAHAEQGTVYLLLDATSFEERERIIQTSLVLIVVAATLIALWLGAWLSVKVISPVTALARQVADLKPNAATSPRVAIQYAEDEVGKLAETFDLYLQEIEQFIRREQEFTADASHELRTPLAVINGAAELLLENPELPERARGQVERIARACERMVQMLEVLLLLARESGASRPANQDSCRVQDVVTEVLEQHRFLVRDKSVSLRAEVMRDFELPVSRPILSIVLSNLIRNAINHSERGEVTVTVDAGTVEITDSGAGISSDDINKIFDRHYRGHNVKTAGSGLGLAIVKRIFDRQRWRIEINSELGHGTRVTLRF